ncbi:hypothetical protein ID866_12569 [Astraeus odoratus]|nr:hypothetical protein ID866_12569 [Astraeus odoratus]
MFLDSHWYEACKPQPCTPNACRHARLASTCLGLRISLLPFSGLCSSSYYLLAFILTSPQCIHAPCFASLAFPLLLLLCFLLLPCLLLLLVFFHLLCLALLFLLLYLSMHFLCLLYFCITCHM